MSTPRLDPTRVRDLFDYRDGVLFWRENRGTRARKGAPAGCKHPGGAIAVVIDRRIYLRSRLTFAWHFGRWPEGHMRHLNDVQDDDRIENLRDTPIHEIRRLVRGGGKYLPGVQRMAGRWLAMINVDGTVTNLGRFDTEWEAHQAFARAHVAVYGDKSPYAKEISGNRGKQKELPSMPWGYANV